MSVTFPEGFVWGVAAASHQIEGGNWNNDWWEFEHKPDTPCVEPSGDCTNSFHLYADDIALVRDHGFGAYRFSIEWSRIEPEDGEFSIAALDYYRRVLAECHEQGVQPVVTFHHFSNPRWVAADGGWEVAADRRPLHALLRAHGRTPRRPHLDRLHDQRAEHPRADGLRRRRVPARADPAISARTRR